MVVGLGEINSVVIVYQNSFAYLIYSFKFIKNDPQAVYTKDRSLARQRFNSTMSRLTMCTHVSLTRLTRAPYVAWES